MPNNFTRIDTSKLYQPFYEKLIQLATNCEVRGYLYIVTSGLRTFEEQTALFAVGRTKPGLREM